jgi:hypothetical protein
MNKLFLFLAFTSFALVACSDDSSSEYHAGCSKSTKPKDCLIGVWQLKKVERANGADDPYCNYYGDYGDRENRSDQLTFEKNGEFSFAGGILDIDIMGDWSLNEDGTIMNIECLPKANCVNYPPPSIPDVINASFEVTAKELRVTTPGYTSFSRCKLDASDRLTEVFFWVGPKK